MDEKMKNIQICPKCRVLYEKCESCVKCGTKLVPKDSFQEEGEPKGANILKEKELLKAQIPQKQQEEPQVLSSLQEEFKNAFVDEVKREPHQPLKPLRPAKRLSEYRIGTVYRCDPRSKLLSPVPLVLAVIVILIGVVAYLSTKRSDLSASTSEKAIVLAPVVSSVPSNSSSQGEELEIEKIKMLLENIRQANLQKNMEFFMSCYALDFKDREGKRLSTLNNWKKVDYLDLSYSLKNQTVSGDTADIEVEWLIKTSVQENRIVVDASLKKEDGNWRIKETKTAN